MSVDASKWGVFKLRCLGHYNSTYLLVHVINNKIFD